MKKLDLRMFFTPVDSQSKRANNFNIIRFIAAFMVVYGHMSSIMGEPDCLILSQKVSTIGVKTIFTISGYLIAKSWLSDSHYGRFMIRRTFRIFPALIVVVLLSAYVLGPIMTTLPVAEYFSNFGTRFYLKNILMFPVYALPGVFTDCPYPNAVNGSLWTMPVEFGLYLVLPVLLTVFKKLKVERIAVGCAAILSLIISVLYSDTLWVIYGTNIPSAFTLLPYYFAGVFFALPEMRSNLNFQLATILLVLASFVDRNAVVNEIAVAIALPYFVLSFGLMEKPAFSKWFEKADYAYGIYLYGFPVQQTVQHFLGGYGLSILSMSIVSFVFALLMAMVSWRVVEKHVQVLTRRILQLMK